MNAQHRLKWELIRQKGKSKYLISRGILPYSIGLTIILGLVEFFSQEGSITIWTPIRVFLFGFLGFFIANSRWQHHERQYMKTK